MKKMILTLLLFNLLLYGDFMDSVESMIKSGIGGEKKVHHFPKVETVGTIETLSTKEEEKKPTSYLDDISTLVKETTGLSEKKESTSSVIQDKNEVTLSTLVDKVKESVGIKEKKKKKESLFSSVISKAKSSIGLEEKTSNPLSVDGIKDTILTTVGAKPKDTSLLTTIQTTTSEVFGTAKNTGKSAELMSGISYKGTKLMNKAVKKFEESPLNVFESKEDKASTGLGSVLDAGNSLLDLVD